MPGWLESLAIQPSLSQRPEASMAGRQLPLSRLKAGPHPVEGGPIPKAVGTEKRLTRLD